MQDETWVFCSTENCPGDGRYAAPGRGHIEGCRYPHRSALDVVLDNLFVTGEGKAEPSGISMQTDLSDLYDKGPKFMGVHVTFSDGKEPKPLEDVGEILSVEKDDEGVYAVIKIDPVFLDWLERSQEPQERAEVRRWWYPFTRIKKLLSRS